MINCLLGMLLSVAGPAEARTYPFTKQVVPHKLQKELKAAGFQVLDISCSQGKCDIVMPDSETKNPQPIINAHVYVDYRADLAAKRAAVLAIMKKWKTGPITPDEKDTILKALVEHVLGQDD